MSIELDHVFAMCAIGAPEAEALVRAGIREGSPNTHPGQGTACRRFFFEGAYLELLWVEDEKEARNARTRPTRLWERWVGRDAGCSPFGIVLRPEGAAGPPFPTWAYHPAYLPPELAIDIAVGSPLAEPESFFLGFAGGAGRGPAQPTDHELPLGRVRSLRVDMPSAVPLSPAARALERLQIASFTAPRPSFLQIVFEGEGRTLLDLRPQLPLALRF